MKGKAGTYEYVAASRREEVLSGERETSRQMMRKASEESVTQC